MGYKKEGISQIEYDELVRIVQQGENSPILLDVREVEEYTDGHIPGIPLLPMGEIVDVIDQFERDEEYIFVCRSGRRSHEVAKFFKSNGFDKVRNYAGGMLEWKSEIKTGEENIVKDLRELYKKGAD
ncbi:rhodanese-like domain-containing protein [Aquibacillus sp. 3ASR75-11]|uniref:Rhodanese-like domain-containing protein n=1 Tax=Terrihalobacillus insolitus TaxID=2950438 RepID=A0A9X3WUF0_9BACI|nr:rhodanese-like domain-containing protein [Terrihalobacillus insolitus]MDC3414716.1 rhodanese-like domain-containing protein [Terrihalobacillus insolitus]MDC3424171.1 rhodanese-like domain-containing protein [Terrihalobacillus insolitus]